MSDCGWIKLHRKLLDSVEWNSLTDGQFRVMITILLLANHSPNEWMRYGEKYTVKEGQFITSLPNLATTSNTSIQTVRSTLKKLEKSNFLTDEPTGKSTGKGRLITIVNWAKYQGCAEEPTDEPTGKSTGNQQATNRQPTGNQQLTRMKEGENERMKESLQSITSLSPSEKKESVDTSYQPSRKKTAKQESTLQIYERISSEFDIGSVLDSTIREWIAYKTERHESYKETGLKTLIRKIINMANVHGDDAVVNIISESMSSNYAGIIWDRINKTQHKTYAEAIEHRYDGLAEWAMKGDT